MNRFRFAPLLFLTLTLVGCPEEPPVITPRAPAFVPRNSDTSRVPQGINPSFFGQVPTVFVHWYKNTDRSLDGYRLFRTDTTEGDGTPIRFRLIRELPLGLFNDDTLYVDDSVEVRKPYYYRVRAFLRSGEESTSSGSVGYEPRLPVSGLSPNNTILKLSNIDTLAFEWRYLDGSSTGPYVLRLFVDKGGNSFQPEDCVFVYFKNDGVYTDTETITFGDVRRATTGAYPARFFTPQRELQLNTDYAWWVATLPENLNDNRTVPTGAYSPVARFRLEAP